MSKFKVGQILYDPSDNEEIRITKVCKNGNVHTLTTKSAKDAEFVHTVGFREIWEPHDMDYFTYLLKESSTVKSIMEKYE